MNTSFEYTTALEYRLKALEQENSALKSGEKYTRIKKNIIKLSAITNE